MPIYEYRCSACGHELEALQKLRDAPLTVCPSCGKPELRKQVSAAGFQLKGSGWYVTDFRNSGAKASGKEKAGKDAAKDNGGGDTASDGAKSSVAAKPETKGTETTTTSTSESKPSASPASKSET